MSFSRWRRLLCSSLPVIGVMTALFAATIALTQNDIKKVLAYSTVCQLGYMFIGIGVGGFAAAVFHLMTHAFFKACCSSAPAVSFMACIMSKTCARWAASRLHADHVFHFLDFGLAISGTPGTAGFFSKDEILWLAFSNHHPVIWALAVIGAGMTAFYMFRQLFMVFFGECRADHHTQEHLHESPKVMTLPLVILAGRRVVSRLDWLASGFWRQPICRVARTGDCAW